MRHQKLCKKKIKQHTKRSLSNISLHQVTNMPFFKNMKDKIDLLVSKSNVIYQLKCSSCSLLYIGKDECITLNMLHVLTLKLRHTLIIFLIVSTYSCYITVLIMLLGRENFILTLYAVISLIDNPPIRIQ